MPTLLQINVCVNKGSTGRIAEQIGEAAMLCGWDSYIAYGRFEAKSSSKIIKIGHTPGIWLHALLSRLTDKQGLYSHYATKRLIKKIKDINPDIIHLHNIHGYYINYKILFEYLKNTNKPVIWTLHDCWPITGHCTHFEYIKCNQWMSGCYDCSQKNSYPTSWVLDNSKNNYEIKRSLFTSVKNLTLVSVSQWLNGIVGCSFLQNHNRCVIYNGVDIELFSPQQETNLSEQYSINDRKIVLGVASSWNKWKGLDDFTQLHKIIDNSLYQIVLIGLSLEQIRLLPKGIIGISKTNSQKELAQWYSLASVYVNLSYAETFGMTTIEALSSGTPSIVYNTTACPELITPTIGQVVQIGDISGVAQAIETICKENRDKTRCRCREYAVTHFSKSICFKKYTDLYENILKLK